MSSPGQRRRTSGPDFLNVTGKSEPLGSAREILAEIRMKALDRARELYGAGARLEVVDTGTVHALPSGKYAAPVTVHCLDFPEEEL